MLDIEAAARGCSFPDYSTNATDILRVDALQYGFDGRFARLIVSEDPKAFLGPVNLAGRYVLAEAAGKA